jgi:Flp pilus assembly pilin Flp
MDVFALTTWLRARFGRDERGAAMVEYGLLLGLIFVVAIVAIRAFGEGVGTRFSSVSSQVTEAGN